jgi:hypothetical protein
LQLLGGDGDDVGDLVNKQLEKAGRMRAMTTAAGYTPHKGAPSNEHDPAVKAELHRALTENCIISEVLASLVLFVIVGTEEFLEASNFGGPDAINLITYGLNTKRRMNSLLVYTLFVVFQCLGLVFSHHLILYKNELREKALQMQMKAKIKLSRGCSHAFFISHHQATGGDQVDRIQVYKVIGTS